MKQDARATVVSADYCQFNNVLCGVCAETFDASALEIQN